MTTYQIVESAGITGYTLLVTSDGRSALDLDIQKPTPKEAFDAVLAEHPDRIVTFDLAWAGQRWMMEHGYDVEGSTLVFDSLLKRLGTVGRCDNCGDQGVAVLPSYELIFGWSNWCRPCGLRLPVRQLLINRGSVVPS